MDDQNKNLILATALSFIVIVVWTILFAPDPIDTDVVASDQNQTTTSGDIAAAPPSNGSPTAPSLGATTATTRENALTRTERIAIETPRLVGSLSLTGARIDDLQLLGYRETLDDEAPQVTLFSPSGASDAYYALHGWAPTGELTYDSVPGATTEWQIQSGSTLSPGAPITLAWNNAAGLTFRRTISIDEDYMFTIDQSVENTSSETARIAPYGILARHGEPDITGIYILHEGVVQSTDGEIAEIDYNVH